MVFARVPWTLALLGAFLSVSSASAQDGTVVAGELGQRLDQAVQRAGEGGFWGVVLAARGGEVLLAKGYGAADYAQRPNTPRTFFEVASTSKPFTAAAILRLVQAKRLRLDTPLGRIFPEVPPDKQAITVHQLLTHTSGIDNEVGLPYASPASREAFVGHVLAAKMISAPGERFAYFNSGYALLAAIVEVVTGGSFEDFAREALFRPAGMADTGFIGDPGLARARMSVRRSEQGPPAPAADWHWGWGYRGMGGVVTTVFDLLAWDRALRGDAILDAETRALAYEPALEGYACGWQIAQSPDGTTIASHSGGVAGFRANYVRYLEDDLVFIALTNDTGNPHAITAALAELVEPRREVEAHLDLRGLRLDAQRKVELGSPAWKVARKGDRVIFALQDGKRTPALLSLPRPAARALHQRLEGLLPGQKPRPRGQQAALDLGGYPQLAGNQLQLEACALQLQPRHPHPDAEGRLTLVLIEGRNRPLRAHLDQKAAKQLEKRLAKALRD